MERQEKAHLEDGLGGSQKRMVKARREKTDQRRKVCCSFRSSICLVFEAREATASAPWERISSLLVRSVMVMV